MSNPVEQVRKLLSAMTVEELAEVQAHCAAFQILTTGSTKTSGGRQAVVSRSDQDQEEALFNSLRAMLAAYLHTKQARYNSFKHSKFYPEFKAGADRIIAFWKKHAREKSHAELISLMRASAVLVMQRFDPSSPSSILGGDQNPLSWWAISSQMKQFEFLVEKAFPGYLASEMMYVVVNCFMNIHVSFHETKNEVLVEWGEP